MPGRGSRRSGSPGLAMCLHSLAILGSTTQ
jgi:hypothetical protein